MAGFNIYKLVLGLGLLVISSRAQVYEAPLTLSDTTTTPAVDSVFEDEIQHTRREVEQLAKRLARQKARLQALQRARQASRGSLDRASDERLRSLENKVDRLTAVLDKLTQTLSNQLSPQRETPPKTPEAKPEPPKPEMFTLEDSLALLELQRREAALRSQIGALTLEIIRLTDELERRKRHLPVNATATEAPLAAPNQPLPPVVEEVSAAAIDSAAQTLLAQGKSLEEARLEVINHIPDQALAAYIKSLPPKTRHALYERIDTIQVRDNVSYSQARRMAVYFHLYAP